MEMSKTIFGRKPAAAKPKHFEPKKQSAKPRKKRSDAKHDIKFKLSSEDKKILKLRAMDHNLSLTAFASLVVKRELMTDCEFDSYEYDEGQFVHVMLDKHCFEMVKTLSVEWDLSFRRVVHRMIKEYIWRETGGVKIINYNE